MFVTILPNHTAIFARLRTGSVGDRLVYVKGSVEAIGSRGSDPRGAGLPVGRSAGEDDHRRPHWHGNGDRQQTASTRLNPAKTQLVKPVPKSQFPKASSIGKARTGKARLWFAFVLRPFLRRISVDFLQRFLKQIMQMHRSTGDFW